MKAYFISDLHLGAKYIADKRAAERRVVDFLMSIRDDATDLYLMGDILDYWYEYRVVVPRGYVRLFGALASLADSGVKIHWYLGNHDMWQKDYLRDEIGIEVVDEYKVEEIYGKKFYLSHGDGVGRLKPGYRVARWIFRSKLCRALYGSVHPRWTLPFAMGWSNKNREFEEYQVPQYLGLDREPQAQFAMQYLRDVDPDINFFVFGHRHVLVDEPLTPTCRLIILGDWITQFSYATWDGTDFLIHTL